MTIVERERGALMNVRHNHQNKHKSGLQVLYLNCIDASADVKIPVRRKKKNLLYYVKLQLITMKTKKRKEKTDGASKGCL